jgi:hypothetical protein
MQTSYVFRCGNGSEEKPKVIANPQLRTRETTTRHGLALGLDDIRFVMREWVVLLAESRVPQTSET